ncbi:hypothetical protein UFOVP431_74 [uncultured Caudovirales phage]|uniref:Uncharacterized protein n=1 Tax=uncultured Caudovirales phage TaxID=2100421 RepID=A0A6J5MST2_9CAUD|nr:hypothetical protein UFOVP431_74 [uncultured Caudovirales phage]
MTKTLKLLVNGPIDGVEYAATQLVVFNNDDQADGLIASGVGEIHTSEFGTTTSHDARVAALLASCAESEPGASSYEEPQPES